MEFLDSCKIVFFGAREGFVVKRVGFAAIGDSLAIECEGAGFAFQESQKKDFQASAETPGFSPLESNLFD